MNGWENLHYELGIERVNINKFSHCSISMKILFSFYSFSVVFYFYSWVSSDVYTSLQFCLDRHIKHHRYVRIYYYWQLHTVHVLTKNVLVTDVILKNYKEATIKNNFDNYRFFALPSYDIKLNIAPTATISLGAIWW